jgi:phage-related protein
VSTFNAGAIEASLTLGRSNWTRDLKKTQKEIADLERKTITIGVDLDTINAQVQMDNLELFLEDLDSKEYQPSVDLVVREAMEALEALEARLEALDARRVVVELDADSINAEIVLDNLEDHLNLLDTDTVTIPIDADAGDAHTALIDIMTTMQRLELDGVDINVDVDGYGRAVTQLNILESQVDILDGRVIDLDVDVDRRALKDLVGVAGGDGSGGHLGLLRILIYALILLSPILAVAMGAMTAAIIGFAAAAAGAVGTIAVLGAGLVGLKKRFDETDPSQYTPGMQAFADSIDAVKGAWDTFLDGIETTGFDLMANAMQLVADILPTLVPVFNAVATMLDGVVDSIRGFVESPEYQEMIDFFSGFGVDMLESFLRIGGNLLRFFGRLFQAIEPFAREMMSGLEDVTAGWAAWADDLENNQAFQDFMDNALKYGPMVLDMLGSMIQAFRNIGEALQPFAGPMLEGLTWFFDLIANADPTVLTIVIGALAGLWFGLNVLAPVISLVAGAVGALSLALGVGALPIILIAGLIAGLIATFVHLWNTNEEFRTRTIETWESIKATVMPILEDLKAWWDENWPAMESTIMEVWDSIKSVVNDSVEIITQVIRAALGVIGFIWDNWGEQIMGTVRGIFQIVSGIIRGAFQVIQGIFQVVSGILTGNWSKVWDGLKNIVSGNFTAISGIIRGLITIVQSTVEGIRTRIGNMVGFFQRLPGQIATATAGMWDGISGAFRGMLNDIIGWWNGLSLTLNIPDAIPGMPKSFTITTPNVGYFANGGYITEPTLGVIGEGKDNEIIAPEPVLERIVRENGGANLDYGRLAAALASALGSLFGHMITKDDMERLIAAASVNVEIDARSEGTTAEKLAAAIGYQLRVLGYGGKANV